MNTRCPHLNCLVYHPNGVCNCDMSRYCRECKKESKINTPQYQCQSWYDGESKSVKDCTCGKCADALKKPINTKTKIDGRKQRWFDCSWRIDNVGCGVCKVCKYLDFIDWAESVATPGSTIERNLEIEKYLNDKHKNNNTEYGKGV